MRIYDPTVSSTAESGQAAIRARPLRGLRVGIIDNSKPNFDFLARDVAEILAREHGAVLTDYVRKHSMAAPASETEYARLATTTDLVIAGSGD